MNPWPRPYQGRTLPPELYQHIKFSASLSVKVSVCYNNTDLRKFQPFFCSLISFILIKIIIVTNKVKQIMYSIHTPPFQRGLKQPPPFLYGISISQATAFSNHKNNVYPKAKVWTSGRQLPLLYFIIGQMKNEPYQTTEVWISGHCIITNINLMKRK